MTPQTKIQQIESTFRHNSQSFSLNPIPRSPRNNLTRPKMKLTRTIHKWRPIIINITHQFSATITVHLSPLPLNTPIIQSLEKRSDFVLFYKLELGGVNHGERESAFIAGLEVEVRGIEVFAVEI